MLQYGSLIFIKTIVGNHVMHFIKKHPYALTFLVAIILIAGFMAYLRYCTLYPSTDDAYVKANIIEIASQVNGKIKQLNITDNQLVHKHQLLFEVDPASYQLAVDQAQDNLQITKQKIRALITNIQAQRNAIQEAQANYINANKQATRIIKLQQAGQTTAAEKDKAVAERDSTHALLNEAKHKLKSLQEQLGQDQGRSQIQAAKITLQIARLNLKRTKIYSPVNGNIANLNLRAGSFVAVGEPLFAVIDKSQWWVTANFKETQLKRIREGQTVNISIDMYPDHTFKGIVQSISPSSGDSFSFMPAENASGNWVKVTQRFPVRIKLEPVNNRYPYRVGATCNVTVNTNHG